MIRIGIRPLSTLKSPKNRSIIKVADDFVPS